MALKSESSPVLVAMGGVLIPCITYFSTAGVFSWDMKSDKNKEGGSEEKEI